MNWRGELLFLKHFWRHLDKWKYNKFLEDQIQGSAEKTEEFSSETSEAVVLKLDQLCTHKNVQYQDKIVLDNTRENQKKDHFRDFFYSKDNGLESQDVVSTDIDKILLEKNMEEDILCKGRLSPDSGIAVSPYPVNNSIGVTLEAERNNNEIPHNTSNESELHNVHKHPNLILNNMEGADIPIEEMPVKVKNMLDDENVHKPTLTSINTLLPSMNKRDNVDRIKELEYNQSSSNTEPIVIIAKKSKPVIQNGVNTYRSNQLINLGSFPSEAFFVENTTMKKSVRGRNQCHKLGLIAREKSVITISNDKNKSKEKTCHKSSLSLNEKNSELNRITCKAYRMKK